MNTNTEQQPTPETDSAQHANRWEGYPVCDMVDADFARKLERERDEARESKDRISKRAEAIRCELVEKDKQLDALQAELADIRQRLKGHADSKLDGENGLASATMRGFDQLQAENEAMRDAVKVSLIRAYTAGYQHGHEATVEGGFIPVHHSDETEFHAENIHQMLCDGSLPELQPLIKP